jgi:hypothetical protein
MKKIRQSVKIKVVLKMLKMMMPKCNQAKIKKSVKSNSYMVNQLSKKRFKKTVIKNK